MFEKKIIEKRPPRLDKVQKAFELFDAIPPDQMRFAEDRSVDIQHRIAVIDALGNGLFRGGKHLERRVKDLLSGEKRKGRIFTSDELGLIQQLERTKNLSDREPIYEEIKALLNERCKGQ